MPGFKNYFVKINITSSSRYGFDGDRWGGLIISAIFGW